MICGAGPAGLTAAYLLTKAGHQVTVLEADRLVGGLARTVEHQGYRFDIGGHRFFTQLPVVQALWEELLDGQMIDVPRLSRIYYKGRYFQYPLQLVDALQGLGPVECARIFLSYTRARLFPARQVENFEQWVSNRFGGRLYRDLLQDLHREGVGHAVRRDPAEWAAQRIQGLSLSARMLSATPSNRRPRRSRPSSISSSIPGKGPGRCGRRVVTGDRARAAGSSWSTGSTAAGASTDGRGARDVGATRRMATPLRGGARDLDRAGARLVGRRRSPPPPSVQQAAARVAATAISSRWR